jgi:N-acetylneuraminic acid mutarotase
LNDNIYVFGGLSEVSHYLQDFWKFNVLTRTWQMIPNAFKKNLAGHTMTVNEDEKERIDHFCSFFWITRARL